MNENGSKKREWVKTAAIIFLTVMLILTFFSNTFMNYSLPEVATVYVQSGTITAKIRGSGVVESSDPYNVEVKESRKVAEVAVKVGDTVQKGDVLVYLEDAESEELKAAIDALEEAERAYETALLSAEVTAADIQAAQSATPSKGAADIQAANSHISTATYRQRITAAQNAVTAAENEVKAAQKTVDLLQAESDAAAADVNGNETDAEKAYNVAKTNLENAQYLKDTANAEWSEKKNWVDALRRQIEQDEQISGSDVSGLRGQLYEAEAEANSAQSRYNNANLEVEKWQLSFDRAKKLMEAEQGLTDKDLADAKRDLKDKEELLEEKKEDLADLTGQISRSLGLEKQQEAIAKAEELVNELTEKSIGATITAPISGVVTAVNVKAGGTTSIGNPVMVMQPEGKGFTMSFSVTNEQAKRVSVGDQAELVNAWRYNDVTVTLASIKPDPNEPGQKKLLTFDVAGEVTAGQSLNLSVGQKSANYDLIVPNSAIREDNNGKFILIVESKSTPLGTRYSASRVDVEVLASDDTQSAISGALYSTEFVITTSTKPVEAGKLIRLANN